MVFYDQRDLFSELELVFFDTTSIYFEGRGGETIGQKGFSKWVLTTNTNLAAAKVALPPTIPEVT